MGKGVISGNLRGKVLHCFAVGREGGLGEKEGDGCRNTSFTMVAESSEAGCFTGGTRVGTLGTWRRSSAV
jgi:hypothetical protein